VGRAHLVFVLTALLGASALHAAVQRSGPPQQRDCGSAVDYQVLLDRLGFSPGQIDDQFGRNTELAIRAFQQENNLPPTGTPSCDTWRALRSRDQSDTLVLYTVTADDLAGPFVAAIPNDMEEQAKLPALNYRSPAEELGERFHVSPKLLLTKINPGLSLQAGVTLRVPNVPQDFPALAAAGDVTSSSFSVEVSRDSSALVLRDAGGRLVFFAPATVGSEHDPLPIGGWKVKGVAWHPVFHYNPDLFWDADPADAKVTVPAGPNNPVGIVWIALDLAHYGIHGTPDPNLVGHSYSHGCIRLTNWDAATVARAVRPGTEVHFR
jgi:lipoprotein-anchoring transpeptidase ErfK/SrfK